MRDSVAELHGRASSPSWSISRALAIFAVWTFVGGLFAARFLTAFGYAGTPATLTEALTRGLLDAWLWAAVTPGLLALGHRYPLRPLSWRHGLIHAAAAPLVALTLLVAYQGLVARLPWLPTRAGDPRDLVENLLTYAVVAALGHYLALQREIRNRELRSAVLEKQLVDARLALLRSQLRPHFLFNTLHTVSELLHEEPDRAEELLTDIGDLLRASLQDDDPQLIPIPSELELVAKYLAICEARCGGRVRTEVSNGAELRDRRVPAFVLQPLVENAFLHGVEPARGLRYVRVSARESGDDVVLSVEDDGLGVGSCAAPAARTGHGLRLVQERLDCLYAGQASLRIEPRSGGGTLAEIRLPADPR